MKPFDEAKAEAGAKVVTRDGRPARIVCFDLEGRHPIGAVIEREDFDGVVSEVLHAIGEVLHAFGSDGRYYTGTTQDKDSSLDLFMAPDKKYSAVWMCRDGRVMCLPFPYDSKDDLEEYLRKQYGLHEFQIVEFEL